MKKIRINELARDLEVKAHLILDKLPELGVTEKKTHSSSVDEDVAEKLRQIFGGDYTGERHTASDHDDEHEEEPNGHHHFAPPEDNSEPGELDALALRVNAPAVSAPAPPPAPPATPSAPAPAASAPPAAAPPPQLPVSAPSVPPMSTVAPAPPAETTAAPEENAPAAPRQAPVRPPLASGGPLRPPVVGPRAPQPGQSAPLPRPAAPHLPSAVPAAAAPAQPQAAQPARPAPPAARPLPTMPRPGQVLSGPRQPFPPPGQPSASPGPARPQVTPGAPLARVPQPPRQSSAPQGAQPVGPRPGPNAPRGPLVGQPAPRPVVPPRPDLIVKLSQQQQPRPASSSAPSPRPGAPMRAPQSATPGQPIYRGPARPGQPSSMPQRPGPGGPMARTGPGAPRPSGPRPMHPTTPRGFGAPGLVPPPPDTQRRPAPNRGGRPQPRDRHEEQEKHLRPLRRDQHQGPPPINREITISEGITVKELSEKLDVKANLVIKKLVDRGIFATINQTLDGKLATDIARDFGASTSTLTYEEEANWDIEIAQEDKDMIKRAPVVTIMGHVDHGKTSLLDAIRLANVADREAGGITQHIGAYHVEKNGRKIVFIDTPGHEAFTRMRSRGAKITDIVILVVAADDGVMPQTLEAIDHARAAKVPILVAINKIDKPGAQPDRIKQQLSDRGLLAEDWGGDTVMVPVSARTKENLDTLLEMILLVADLGDLKANPGRPAVATVIEAKLDRGRGPVATVLVRNGTLRVGDYFICGQVFGKVRAMLDDRGNQVREAEPSMPVEVLGLDALPDSGDDFQVVTDTGKAKQIVIYREAKAREQALAKNKRMTLEQFNKQMAAGEVKELPLILKADVNGSAEVLSDTLQRLSTDKVRVNILRSGVGAITESDVLLASASEAIVIGFNVKPDRSATAAAEQEKVDVRLHTIIYNLIDEIKAAMTGLLAPVYKEVYRGKAEVRDTFRVTKVGMVAGCMVLDGSFSRDCQLRLVRENVVVHNGKVGSLRRFKDDVREVTAGMECGITIDNWSDVQKGDIIEGFVQERVKTEVI